MSKNQLLGPMLVDRFGILPASYGLDMTNSPFKFTNTLMVLLLMATVSTIVASPLAEAKTVAGKMKVNLRPDLESWDYLSSTNSLQSEPEGISKLIYNKSAISELGAKYEALQKNREMRSHHNLNTYTDELSYDRSSRDMVSTYLRAVLRGHFHNAVRGARLEVRENLDRKRREKNRESSAAPSTTLAGQKPQAEKTQRKSGDKNLVSVAAAKTPAEQKSGVEMKLDEILHSAWMVGENIVERHQSISLWSDAEARLHYDLPGGTMYVNFLSSIIDGEMKYRVRSEPLPFTGGSSDNSPGKMSVSLMRSFPEITMNTGLVYGVDTSTVGANLSKHLSGPLSAQVSRSLSLRESQPTSTTVQLNVGIGF